MTTEKRTQVSLQCKVVAHLARVIGQVHGDLEKIFASDSPAVDDIVEQVGARTARLMETLGDVINGMDACTENDDWTHPIFKEAHRLWLPPRSP